MVDSASHPLLQQRRSEGSGPRDVSIRYEGDEATRVNTASSDVFSMAFRGCERAPGNPAAWELLEQTARAPAQVERVFELYRDMLASGLPPAILLPLGVRAVRFHDEWDEDGQELLEVLMRLLEIDPTLQWAFDRASVQLTMLGRWGDLLGLYDGAIAVSETDRRLTLLDEAARVAKDGAGEIDRAICYLDALFEANGRGLQVASSIDRLLAQQGRHEDRIHLWERRLQVADPAEVDGLLEKIAMAPASSADQGRGALERLRRRYDSDGRGSHMIRVLEAALGHVRGQDAVAMHAEVARRLVEGGCDDRAIEHLAAVLALDPEACDDHVLDRLLTGTFEDALAGCRLRFDLDRARTLVHAAARLAGAREVGRERAVHLYRALLGHRPDDVLAIAGLAEIHRALGAHAELIRLNEHELRFAADRSRRLALRLDIARLHAALGDPGAGIAALRDNLVDDPEDGVSVDALGRLYCDLGEHAEAVIWLERSLALAPARDRAEPTSRLARAHLAAGHRDQAIAVLEHRLCAEPGDLTARTLLLELRRAGDDREALASALIEGATYVEGARQRALLREAADVLTHELGEVDDAIVLLQRLVADDAGDVAVRADLAEATRRAGRVDEARAIAEALVGQFGRRHAPERSAMHLLLARVARADGDDQEALQQLELAVSTDARNASAHRLLGKLCRKLGQHARAERAFQILLQRQRRRMGRSARDGAGIAISETLFELYRVATLLGDTRRAAENLASAFDVARNDEAETARLEHALRRAGMTDLLLQALEQRLARTAEARGRAAILAEQSAALESLGRDAEALESALLALTLAPRDAVMHERARSVAARADDTGRYARSLESLVEVALGSGDGRLGCELLLRLGAVYEHELEQADNAAAAYKRAEDTSENLVEVWRAMAGLAAKRLDRVTHLASLRKLADSPEVAGEERAEALYTAADLELQTSDTTEPGLATLALALDTPGCAPRWAHAALSLRKALQVSIDREPIVRLYESVARASGEDALLLDALWAASTLPRPPQETLREAFALASTLGAGDRATRLLERAVEAAQQDACDPADALWAMLQLAEQRESAGDLGAALLWMTRAADVSEPQESSRLLMGVAELAMGRAGDPDLAAQSYERVLDGNPGELDAWHGLLAVHRASAILGDSLQLELTLARACGELPDPCDRNRLRMELGELLLQQSERSAEARDVLQAVLDEDPDHEEAAQRLAALLQRTGDDGALATLLARQLDGARDRKDASAGLDVALRLGALLSERDRRGAVDVYRGTLGWIPDHPQLLRRLVEVLDPRDDAAERAERIEQLIADESAHGVDPHAPSLEAPMRWFAESLIAAAAQQPSDAATLLCKAAAVLRDRLADPIAAKPVLERALAVVTAAIERCAPDDPTLAERFALRASVRSACCQHAAAVADLEQALALDGDRWLPELHAALGQAGRAASEDGDLEAERHFALRQSELLGRSGQTVAARAVLTDLVEGSFYDREVTEHLLALDVAAERWPDVLKGCNKLLAFECGPELASVALVLADACDKLGCPEEARGGLERAQDQDPANTALRDRLRALYERMAAHGPLADLLVIEAGEAPDDDRRFGLLREAGRLRLRRTDAPASAVGPLSEAASLCPTDHEVTLLLADALLAAGLVGDAARLLDDAIARHAGKRSHDLASLQHRMARVVAARTPGKQLPWLVAAFAGHPKNVDIASDLAEVATAHQQYEIALQAWRAVISASEGSPVVRATAYARQARIAQLQGDVARALVLARRAKSEHPELAEATSLLRDLGARP